jgi:hypothetical protein
VTDVTAEVSCETGYDVCADEECTTVIESSASSPCEGGVFYVEAAVVPEVAAASIGGTVIVATEDGEADSGVIDSTIDVLRTQYVTEDDPSTGEADPEVSADGLCRVGAYPDYRRQYTIFRAYRENCRVKTYFYYRRHSDCVHYILTSTSTTALDREPTHRLWSWRIWYTKAKDGAWSNYFKQSRKSGCPRIHYGTWTNQTYNTWGNFYIKPGYLASHEVIDDDEGNQGCTGWGNSYQSLWIKLPGWADNRPL